jgi:hypothetical protein
MDGKGGQIQTNRWMEKADRYKQTDGWIRRTEINKWMEETDRDIEINGKDRQR